MAGDGKHPQNSLKRKRLPLGATRAKTGKKNKKVDGKSKPGKEENPTKSSVRVQLVQNLSSAEQLSFFLQQFQSANAIKLSSLELESIKDSCIVKLSDKPNQDASNLERHIKYAFGSSWRDVLYEGKLVEGKVGPGSPAVIIVSASAIRSLEMLRGLRSLSKKCQPAKLFSKHIKVEEQVTLLRERVNIASGTPSRIKKLCEMEALGLSRLQVTIVDMHTDVKGYSLLTLPQVRIYKTQDLPQFSTAIELSICHFKGGIIHICAGMNSGICTRATFMKDWFRVTFVSVCMARFPNRPNRVSTTELNDSIP